MGQRVRNVMSELSGEKIDIIDFDDDPARFVANALSPAKVVSVSVIDESARAARVVVPDFQLSLAIGKEGQNARLAARLTGWRIDIRGDSPDAKADEPAHDARNGWRTKTSPTTMGDAARLTVGWFRAPSGAGRLAVIQRETSASAHRRTRTGADLHRMPEARAGRRTASRGCRVDRERQIRRHR